MKKLMIALGAVALAAGVQAAQVQWGATATSAYNGQKMYLLTSIAETYDSLEAFEAATIDNGTVSKSGMSYKVAPHFADNDAITKTANYYLAVVDGNTIHYSDVTAGMRDMVFTPPDSTPGAFTIAFANVANSATTATIGGGPSPIPEPTSGLLLLLGVAGLALRRGRRS